VKPGSGHESLCPYQSFETADKPLILGVANDSLWRTFCKVAGRPELANDPKFAVGADRVAHRSETVELVQRIMETKTRAEWMALFEANDIPCSPVHTLGELSQHPHTLASDMILGYKNEQGKVLKAVAVPLRADGERPSLRSRPPRLGEHTADILAEPGYEAGRIEELERMGVIKRP
jgi:crotonobetainyl-CoA:carnitine CoA-transferase CaiB-like acyl-CoA transferase